MTVTLRSTSLLHLDCGGTADHGALAVPLFQLPGPVLHPGGVGAWELTAWSAGQLIITATSAGLRLQARACMRLRLRHWAAGLPTKHLRRPPARPPLPACSATTCTPSTTWACWFSGVSLHRNRGGGGGGPLGDHFGDGRGKRRWQARQQQQAQQRECSAATTTSEALALARHAAPAAAEAPTLALQHPYAGTADAVYAAIQQLSTSPLTIDH